MTTRKIVNRNVVLLPPKSVMDEAIRRSALAAEVTLSKVTLDDKNCLPHLTLHQFAIPEENLMALDEEVGSIVGETSFIQVALSGYSLFGGGGIFWDADKDHRLRSFHQQLVDVIDSLREGYIMDQHREFLTSATDIGKERRKSLGRWGNPLAMNTFWPHITLASCETEEEARKAISALPDGPMEFEAASVHITEVGPNGTCPGSLMEFFFLR